MKTIRIFVSSPGDVKDERQISERVIRRVAAEMNLPVDIRYSQLLRQLREGEATTSSPPGDDGGDEEVLVLCPYFWEYQRFHGDAGYQEQIPRTDAFDLVVCILWTRIGTPLRADLTKPDGQTAASGTEYEIAWARHARELARRAHPEISPLELTPALHVYRNTSARSVDLADPQLAALSEQRQKLDEFMREWERSADGSFQGAFNKYKDLGEFERVFEMHIRDFLVRFLPDPKSRPTARRQLLWDPEQKGSPFRRLDVYEMEHHPVFCGRSRAIGDTLKALRAQQNEGRSFVVILGASGSGKSSLARAGVLPMLVGGHVIEGVDVWRHAILRPGSFQHGGNPCRGLAAALQEASAFPDFRDSHAADPVGKLAVELARNPEGLVDRIGDQLDRHSQEAHRAKQERLRELAASHQAQGRTADVESARADLAALRPLRAALVLLIDQAEELFHSDRRPDEVSAFAAAVASLARSKRMFVIVTLRSDFYDRFQARREFLDLLGPGGRVDLLPPDSDEFGQIIRQPAGAAGLRYDTNPKGKPLDEELRDQARDNPEALPLLSHLLDLLYERQQARKDGWLRWDDYLALGGVEGALPSHAEQIFTGERVWRDEQGRERREANLSSGQQAAFPRVLSGLIHVSRGNQGQEIALRRYAQLRDLTHDRDGREIPGAACLIETLSSPHARLLTLHAAGKGGSPTVSISHEVLIRKWGRIEQWILANGQFLQRAARIGALHQQYLDAAERDREKGSRTAAAYLLPVGLPLEEGRALLDAEDQVLDRSLADYIRESIAAAEREAKARAQRQRKVLISLSTLSALALLAALVAWWQGSRAWTLNSKLELTSRDLKKQSVRLEEKSADLQKTSDDLARNAVALKQANAETYYRLGAEYVSQDRVVDALGELAKALRVAPEHAPAARMTMLNVLDCLQRVLLVPESRSEVPAGERASFAFHPGGKHFATADGRMVRLRDTLSGGVLAELGLAEPASQLVWNPGGSHLLALCGSERWCVMKRAEDRLELIAQGQASGKIADIQLSPDASFLLLSIGSNPGIMVKPTARELLGMIGRGSERFPESPGVESQITLESIPLGSPAKATRTEIRGSSVRAQFDSSSRQVIASVQAAGGEGRVLLLAAAALAEPAATVAVEDLSQVQIAAAPGAGVWVLDGQKLWLASGAAGPDRVRSFPLPAGSFYDRDRSWVLAPQGQAVAAASRQRLEVYPLNGDGPAEPLMARLPQPKELPPLADQPEAAIAPVFSADGRQLACLTSEGEPYVWTWQSEEQGANPTYGKATSLRPAPPAGFLITKEYYKGGETLEWLSPDEGSTGLIAIPAGKDSATLHFAAGAWEREGYNMLLDGSAARCAAAGYAPGTGWALPGEILAAVRLGPAEFATWDGTRVAYWLPARQAELVSHLATGLQDAPAGGGSKSGMYPSLKVERDACTLTHPLWPEDASSWLDFFFNQDSSESSASFSIPNREGTRWVWLGQQRILIHDPKAGVVGFDLERKRPFAFKIPVEGRLLGIGNARLPLSGEDLASVFKSRQRFTGSEVTLATLGRPLALLEKDARVLVLDLGSGAVLHQFPAPAAGSEAEAWSISERQAVLASREGESWVMRLIGAGLPAGLELGRSAAKPADLHWDTEFDLLVYSADDRIHLSRPSKAEVLPAIPFIKGFTIDGIFPGDRDTVVAGGISEFALLDVGSGQRMTAPGMDPDESLSLTALRAKSSGAAARELAELAGILGSFAPNSGQAGASWQEIRSAGPLQASWLMQVPPTPPEQPKVAPAAETAAEPDAATKFSNASSAAWSAVYQKDLASARSHWSQALREYEGVKSSGAATNSTSKDAGWCALGLKDYPKALELFQMAGDVTGRIWTLWLSGRQDEAVKLCQESPWSGSFPAESWRIFLPRLLDDDGQPLDISAAIEQRLPEELTLDPDEALKRVQDATASADERQHEEMAKLSGYLAKRGGDLGMKGLIGSLSASRKLKRPEETTRLLEEIWSRCGPPAEPTLFFTGDLRSKEVMARIATADFALSLSPPEVEAAEALARAAIQRDPTGYHYGSPALARVMIAKGEFAAARDEWMKEIMPHAYQVKSWQAAIDAFVKAKAWAQAEALVDDAFALEHDGRSLHDDQPDLHLLAGWIKWRGGRYPEAAEHFSTALGVLAWAEQKGETGQFKPSGDGSGSGDRKLAKLGLATALWEVAKLEAGRREEIYRKQALEHYKRFLQEVPGSLGHPDYRGLSDEVIPGFSQLKEVAQALDEALPPELKRFREAQSQWSRGEKDAAIALLEEARAGRPDDIDLLVTLARWYEALGKTAEAGEVWQEALPGLDAAVITGTDLIKAAYEVATRGELKLAGEMLDAYEANYAPGAASTDLEGWLYLHLDRNEEALEFFKAVRSVEFRGNAFSLPDRFRRAIAGVAQASTLETSFPLFGSNLGLAIAGQRCEDWQAMLIGAAGAMALDSTYRDGTDPNWPTAEREWLAGLRQTASKLGAAEVREILAVAAAEPEETLRDFAPIRKSEIHLALPGALEFSGNLEEAVAAWKEQSTTGAPAGGGEEEDALPRVDPTVAAVQMARLTGLKAMLPNRPKALACVAAVSAAQQGQAEPLPQLHLVFLKAWLQLAADDAKSARATIEGSSKMLERLAGPGGHRDFKLLLVLVLERLGQPAEASALMEQLLTANEGNIRLEFGFTLPAAIGAKVSPAQEETLKRLRAQVLAKHLDFLESDTPDGAELSDRLAALAVEMSELWRDHAAARPLLEKSLKLREELLRAEPDNARLKQVVSDTRYNLGWCRNELADYAAAEADFAEDARLAPSIQACFRAAHAAGMANQAERAQQWLAKARELATPEEQWQVGFRAAWLPLSAGKPAEALEQAEATLKALPEGISVERMRYPLIEALALEALGRHEEAVAKFLLLIGYDDMYAKADQEDRWGLMSPQAAMWKKFLAGLTDEQKLNSDELAAKAKKAWWQDTAEGRGEALRLAKLGLERGGDSADYFRLLTAYLLEERGQLAEAAPLLAIPEGSDRVHLADVHSNMASYFLQLHPCNPAMALKACERALAIDAGHGTALELSLYAHFAAGDLAGLDRLRKELAGRPQDSLEPELRRAMALMAAARGDAGEVQAWMEVALAAETPEVNDLSIAAWAMIDLGRDREAAALLERVAKRRQMAGETPDDRNLQDEVLREVLAGDLDDAAHAFCELVKLEDKFGKASYIEGPLFHPAERKLFKLARERAARDQENPAPKNSQ